MKHSVRTATAAAAITVSSLVGSVEPAQAYQVDCAILLCLAGGWPASAPCAHARAVFIRRITPWPIEPPLQIWRCPMGVSMPGQSPLPPERLAAVATSREETPIGSLIEIQSGAQADIDIANPAFDFLRSIRVFHIDYAQAEGRENCIRRDATRLGSYGTQGDYRWSRSAVTRVPPASQVSLPAGCASYAYRSVFVEWRDSAGNYGFEEVRY